MKNSSAYALPNPNLVNTQTMLRDAVAVSRQKAIPATLEIARTFLIGLLKVSASLAVGAAGATAVGMLCGSVIDSLYDSLTTFGHPDCILITLALWFLVIPGTFGLLFGGCRTLMRGSRVWYVFPAMVTLMLGAGDLLLEHDVFALTEMLPWIAVATALAYVGMFTGQLLVERKAESNQ